MVGRCRFCRCSWEEPCPQGCGWANRDQTVCTACVPIDKAWRRMPAQVPSMVHAFARGFFSATDDERATETPLDRAANPYGASGSASRWWLRGWDAGARA